MAKRFFTNEEIKNAFESALAGRKQVAVAEEIGVPAQNISAMLKGAPINGKVLTWLGFKRVEGLYERVTE